MKLTKTLFSFFYLWLSLWLFFLNHKIKLFFLIWIYQSSNFPKAYTTNWWKLVFTVPPSSKSPMGLSSKHGHCWLPLSYVSELCMAVFCVVHVCWTPVKFLNSDCFVKDPSNKRQIICDEKLKELFDVDSFNGFTVTKLLAPHFIKTQQWVS